MAFVPLQAFLVVFDFDIAVHLVVLVQRVIAQQVIFDVIVKVFQENVVHYVVDLRAIMVARAIDHGRVHGQAGDLVLQGRDLLLQAALQAPVFLHQVHVLSNQAPRRQ